jgi:beta-galactosidase
MAAHDSRRRLCRACVLTAIAAATILSSHIAAAQNTVRIDATRPGPVPQPVAAPLGASRNPQGETIGVNSEYLTLNGKPWLPVMGEFHFSRYPADEWEEEILKMKASGVQIISTYVIWIHHEQIEGVFDWGGQRDLRRFVQLCAKHGLYVYPRIGPWAHAETRNGGLPDWVVKNSPTRENNPVYLKEVQTFYAQVAQQLQGLLWKEGGPVVGIQIENEYHETGPGKGKEHLRTLKRLALEAGLDVPLYTVTGWDDAAIPLDQMLPVFGGYPAAPWSGSNKRLPLSEIYAFRFSNRSAGSMGAIGGSGQSAAASYRGTPFLTAEVGDGTEDTYFRRPVLSADDVAAIVPVMLGSGVNLLGYYMFHGGRNPEGGDTPLQESQRTGYPTDVPVKSYDFQAPISEFGQERESLRRLKLVNYFLDDFGSQLAPMATHAPDRVPAAPTDLSVPRVAARTAGDRGFLFFNNYVRGAVMPSRPGFQVALKLPSGMVRVPSAPVNLPSGAYGIWPINLALPGGTLRYSTAQLFKRVESAGETYLFFFAIHGVPAEFAFEAKTPIAGVSGALHVEGAAPLTVVRAVGDDPDVSEIHLAQHVHLVLLPESMAEEVWRGDDPSLLVASQAAAFSDGVHWKMESDGGPHIHFALFEASPSEAADGIQLQPEAARGLFQPYTASFPAIDLQPTVTKVRAASARGAWQYGPKLSWRPTPIPLAPDDTDFEHAASWRIEIPSIPNVPYLSNVLLKIDYQGDVGRLYRGNDLIEDNFWNGESWTVGLKETTPNWRSSKPVFDLRILPLPKGYPMFLENAAALHFNTSGFADTLGSVQLVPRYRLQLDVNPVGGSR